MGCFGSKDKLSKEDMEFLKTHTRYDESTIKEWYKGFKVSINFRGELYDEVLRAAFYFLCVVIPRRDDGVSPFL